MLVNINEINLRILISLRFATAALGSTLQMVKVLRHGSQYVSGFSFSISLCVSTGRA